MVLLSVFSMAINVSARAKLIRDPGHLVCQHVVMGIIFLLILMMFGCSFREVDA